jgi:hypothetical protein
MTSGRILSALAMQTGQLSQEKAQFTIYFGRSAPRGLQHARGPMQGPQQAVT